MRRRTLIFAFLQRRDDFDERLADHLDAMNAFARPYYGCDDKALTTETCKPHLAEFRRSAFQRARETAKRLFDLREP